MRGGEYYRIRLSPGADLYFESVWPGDASWQPIPIDYYCPGCRSIWASEHPETLAGDPLPCREPRVETRRCPAHGGGSLFLLDQLSPGLIEDMSTGLLLREFEALTKELTQ